jgi:hypothetical protein
LSDREKRADDAFAVGHRRHRRQLLLAGVMEYIKICMFEAHVFILSHPSSIIERAATLDFSPFATKIFVSFFAVLFV